jgi:serine/threonine protein kinase/tetratricopeptide (TPR) repeat protein
MTDPAPTSGQTFGRYSLLETLGRGGMAEVFKAKSFGVEGFEKVLVIKRIVPELAVHQEFVDMFVQEAKLAVQLSHANIVQVFDLGRIERLPDEPASYYIAMEYVPGVDLASVISHFRRTKTELPLGFAIYVATEVAKALDHAHRRQDAQQRPLEIVHRDISPQNILISWDGAVKVTDFGIAKATDTITRDDINVELEAVRATGKLGFMSPEQTRSERTDARSDLFSLGVVIYQMITGANPFSAPTAAETIRRISVSEYPPLSLARSDAPGELSDIIDRLLARAAEDRFGSAAELSKALLAYSYTSGDRFGADDLSELLSPLRTATEPEAPEVSPASVFEETQSAVDRTPVEIPRASVPPPPQSQPESGERREVTMLVLSFGAAGDAPAQPQLLERTRDVLERHGAWLEEQSPTQVVSIFGLGDTDGRDAEAAVRTALVLVRERRFGKVPSAGVHSGQLNVDDGGIPVRDPRFSGMLATGQALARATKGQVALSPVAGRLVRRSFVTEPLPDSIRALADGGCVVRRALGEAAGARFVGRIDELKTLGRVLASATRRGPQVVVVRGETGLGKSRLLSEAKRRLTRGHYNLAFYSASCPLNGASVPWSGLRAMLHVLCGTQEDDAPERILEVHPRLRALGLRDNQASAMLGLLGAPTDTKESESRVVIRASFERMVSSLCDDRLHCFAWDDAQAIDRETLDAVLRIVRQQKRLRGVFMLAQRGELPPALAKRKSLHLVELAELNEADTTKLIQAQLGARSLPAEMLSYVRQHAGGHPLFIDELLRELCETSVVQVLNGSVTLKPEGHTTAPRTLRTLIADRVSRLQQRERRVLQGLAVLGEPAFTPVLSAVLEQPLPHLDRHLSSLESKSLVRRTGPTRVRFASPLYQEIVLDAMAAAARSELHARAAQTYSETDLPGAGEAADRIADHLTGAGESARAVTYHWQSAHAKLRVGQLENALRSMLTGLELADVAKEDPAQLCNWLEQATNIVNQVRKAPGLKDALSPLLREITARGDHNQRVGAHIHYARALGAVNLFDEAYEGLGYVDVDTLESDELKIAALTTETQLATRQGMFVRAVKAGDRLEALGLDDADALLTLSLARTMDGQTDAALALLDRLNQISPPRDIREQVTRQKHLVLIHFNARDWETAARSAAELAKLARTAGLRFDAAAALHNLGDSSDRLGDHPRAYAAFIESLELTRALEHERLSNLNQMHLCLLDGLRSPEGTEERLKSLVRFADGHGYLWDVLEGRFMLARLAAAHGDHESARRQLEAIIDKARTQGHKLIEFDAKELQKKLQG